MASPAASRSPTLTEVIQRAIDQGLDDLHVSLPAKITEWDEATQKASVKPLIMRRLALEDGSEIVESLPVITGVPVGFPRGGGCFLSFPMAVGDLVVLMFSERSLDAWLSGSGAEADPNDFRRHDLSDAWAYPGVAPWSQAIAEVSATDAVFGKDGGSQVRVVDDDTIEAGSSGGTMQFVALADEVQAQLQALKDAITYATIGFQDGGLSLKTSILDALAAWPASVAGSVLKAEE